ncbi:glycosyltransferase family 4 protein [Stenotrophomonas sp. SY1]|uniref:MraY family glycosyltransferase n=1 Tax=Stenotrophomonas sp. SY1 TaxID=477235 RepID=UPI001E30785E|nr:glycosyltransferase family 4 protein [Stenotrophomonas sp. SY1]
MHWHHLILPLLVVCLAAVVTWGAIHYALRRQLFDLPGARRSHSVSTPRGGGIGIVVSQLFACGAVALLYPGVSTVSLLFALGLLMVAGIGWWDDHRPLPALPRLGVHLLAALLLGFLVWQGTGSAAKAAFCVVLAVSLINIWNFMDGINGLATTQAILVGVGAGLLLPGPYALAGWLLAAGCLGFLPFNFPRARIFMGDVGSGALGYLVAGVLALGLSVGDAALPLWLMLPAAFCIDAGFTLLSRIRKGERWMQPHTQHLYQRFVKRECSHSVVTGGYALFTLSGLTLAVLFSRLSLGWGWAGGVAWLSAAAAVWLFLRRQYFNKDDD